MDGYADALMQYWLEENSQSLIKQLDVPAKPDEKEAALYERGLVRSHNANRLSGDGAFRTKLSRSTSGWRISSAWISDAVRTGSCAGRADGAPGISLSGWHLALVPEMPDEESAGLHVLFCAKSLAAAGVIHVLFALMTPRAVWAGILRDGLVDAVVGDASRGMHFGFGMRYCPRFVGNHAA